MVTDLQVVLFFNKSGIFNNIRQATPGKLILPRAVREYIFELVN